MAKVYRLAASTTRAAIWEASEVVSVALERNTATARGRPPGAWAYAISQATWDR